MSVVSSFESFYEERQTPLKPAHLDSVHLPDPNAEELMPYQRVSMLLESGCSPEDITEALQTALEQQLPILQDYPFLTPQLLPQDQRFDYARSLILLGLNKDALEHDFKGSLYRALCSVTEEERATLGKQLFEKAGEAAAPLAAGAMLAQVLGSMQKVQELSAFIKSVGRDRLFEIDHPEMKEFCAYDSCREIVSACSIPARMSSSAWSRFLVKRTLRSVRSSLIEARKEIESRKELRQSQTGKEYYTLLTQSIRGISELCSGSMFRRDLLRQANAFLKKLPLELRYGICLHTDRPQNYWTEQEISTIAGLLKKLPPLGVVATPGLFQIKKVTAIDDDGTLGARYGGGPIEISTDALNNAYVRGQYNGMDSLALVLCHELGHSFKFGRWGDRFTVGSQQEIEGEANSRYDFASYMSLSGWNLIPRHRYEIRHSGFAVRLDETKEVPLHFPVEHDGERKIFMYDDEAEMLYSYDADASFSVHSYGRSDPYEDWAEAFSEYVLIPRRLVMYAPEKFAFFESCFGCHQHNSQLQSEWQKRLLLTQDYDDIEYLPDA